MTKKQRQQIYEKFDGKCAYSGKPLDDKWQVDHVIPRNSHHYLVVSVDSPFDVDHMDNLLPTLRRLNHYKRAKDLNEWRQYLMSLHERLKKLPKNTRVEKSRARKEYLLDVAEAFGITVDEPFNGTFYFETLTTNP